MKRHKDVLSARFVRNISYAQASFKESSIKKCLKQELKEVQSLNMWNFDETDLVDNTGATKVLVNRWT